MSAMRYRVRNEADDQYFLTSGDKIRYFLEIEAVDREGKLTTPTKERAVNKIGHGIASHGDPFLKRCLGCGRVFWFVVSGFTGCVL